MSTSIATILTIDDEAAIRSSFSLYLTDFDYKVLEAENGRVGLEMIASQKPDLVLVDLRMPEVDGLEVLAEIQKNWSEIPVIVVSGTGEISDVIEALRLGAWDYVLKPIEDMTILTHTIDKALERAELIRRDQEYQQVLEQEVEKQTAEVKAQKSISDAIINNLPGIFCLTDSDFRLVRWNENFVSMSGYSNEELADKRLFDFFIGKDKEVLLSDSKEVDLLFAGKDGRQTPCLFTGQSLIIGGQTCFVGIGLDVTVKQQLEKELRQAQKMEGMGILAGGIAHDFNNILSGIFGFSELAQMQIGRETDAYEYIKNVRTAADRARDLVQQILTFSRKTEQTIEPLQLSLIIKEALKLLRSSIPTTIELKRNINSNGLVLANPGQMHQVLMNLVTNAYQAIGDEVGTITISLRDIGADDQDMLASGHLPDTVNGCLLLEISDSGCGMDLETQVSIFEPYFTTKDEGKGTGLGLAVVHGIIKNHGGTLKVSSEPGKGSTFKVYFNLAAATGATYELAQANEHIACGSGRIMFVDDEDMLRLLVAEYFISHNFEVDVFFNGLDALARLQEDPLAYDLLITDLAMPGMPGDQLINKVREFHPKLPIILCSGYSDILDRESVEGVCIKNKPIVLNDLLCQVNIFLKSRTKE